MNEYSFRIRAVCLVSAVFLLLVAPLAAGQTSQKVITWNFSAGSPAAPGGAYHTYTWGPFANIIAADTNNRLKLTVHENLLNATRVIEGVRDGTVDMGTQIIGFRGELNLFNFVALPIVPNEKAPEIVKAMRPTFRKWMAEKEDVVLLGYGYWAKQRLFSKKPIRTLEDMKGYKLRVANPETLEMIKSVGGNPVFMPMSECYPGLQRGVIEGGTTSLEGVIANKWYEVVQYTCDWPIGNAAFVWIANKRSWAALPTDLQNQILKLFEDKYEPATLKGGLEDDARYQAQLEKLGMKFIKPDPEEVKRYLEKAPPILTKWKQSLGAESSEMSAVLNKVLGVK